MNREEFIKLSLLTGAGLTLQPWIGLGKPFIPDKTTGLKFYSSKDPEYDSLRAGFNSRISRRPDLIAMCESTQDVQEAVLRAAKLKMRVSIKSGGHSMEGFSCGNGGMQINLSRMNQLRWLEDYKISVGPACTLKELYANLLPKNRILPGGSCAGVGIGGLSLGGGYGLMSRLFGLTCDSLLSVTMVDGLGRIISSDGDPELLWACKGGGNGNFGVITEMNFKVHNRPAIMSSYRFRSFNVDTARGKAILKAWFEESVKLPNACFSSCLFNGRTAYVLLTNVSSSNPAVDKFIALMKSLCDKFTSNLKQPLPLALQNYYGQQHPVKFKNASAGLYRSFDELSPMIEEILATVFSSRGMIYQVNTLGGAIQNKAFESTSAFPHREHSFFTELQTYWETTADGERLMRQFETVQQIVARHGVNAQYVNYPDINFRDFEHSYYGKSLARLKSVKRRYDPGNVIGYEQSISG